MKMIRQFSEIVCKTIETPLVSILLLLFIAQLDFPLARLSQASLLVSASSKPPRNYHHQHQHQQQQQQQYMDPAFIRLLTELRAKDTCQTFFTSKLHGYEVQEHIIRTADNYELALHRIIHPSDLRSANRSTNGPSPGTKKPFLLLHGLLGSSGSFVNHIEAHYKAPRAVFDTSDTISDILRRKSSDYQDEHDWQSMAEHWHAAFKGDTSRTLDELTMKERIRSKADRIHRPYASLKDLDFDGDATNFARDFKQTYRKFLLPKDSKGHLTNSLAFTMSNFGYDVWLLNLRGNKYSHHYHGRLNSLTDDYWDFNIDKLIKEDLLASIAHVRAVAKSDEFGPIGFASYSYSSIHLLGLLSKFPENQKRLQPVIMMAPTMFTSTGGTKTRFLMKLTSKFVSQNGPFPALGRGSHDRLTKFICSLPVASKLCRLLEMVLYGQSKSVRQLLFDDQKSSMVKRDVECGQTSTAVLHQILDNLSHKSGIAPNFQPTAQARLRLMKGEKVRRSVILIHSDSDDISSPTEVAGIRDSALKQMTLADYSIKEPNFGHTDFLFSKRNQYLVNAEIVRMATLYDYLMYRPSSNRPTGRRYK